MPKSSLLPSPSDNIWDLDRKLLQGFADGSFTGGSSSPSVYFPTQGDDDWDLTRRLIGGLASGAFGDSASSSKTPGPDDSLYTLNLKLLLGFADGSFMGQAPSPAAYFPQPGDNVFYLKRRLLQGFADGTFTGTAAPSKYWPAAGDDIWQVTRKLLLGFADGTFVAGSSPCVPPLAPTNLALAAGPNNPSDTTATIDWQQPLGLPPVFATQYLIRWGLASGNYNVGSATISGALLNYTITGLSAVTTYYIAVFALNGVCESPASNELATTTACATPAAPSGLQADGAASYSNIPVKWTAAAGPVPVDHYTIRWGIASGVYTNSATVAAPTVNYNITGLNPNTPYFIAVFSENGACESVASNELSESTIMFSAATIDWSNRVVANGDPMPNNAILTAVDTWYKGLVTDGVDSLIGYALIFAPGGVITATTPFYDNWFGNSHNDPATNHGFIAGDLTVNGLIGDGVAKYLDTGVNPALGWLAASDASIAVYTMDGSSNGGWAETGVNRPSNSANNTLMFCNLSGTSYFEMGGFNTSTPQGVAPNKAGFYVGSRTGNTTSALYFANSTNAWASFATAAGAANNAINNARRMFVFALQSDDNGLPNFFSGRRLSAVILGKGWTSAQGQALYNRTQALRVAFGGGFA